MKSPRSLFIQSKTEIPLAIAVIIGKHHVIGVGELGDKSALVEKQVFPFMPKPSPEEIAKEVLRKLDVPSDQWETILATKKEIVI